MQIPTLKNPMNEIKPASGPTTSSFYSNYHLSEEEKRHFRYMALIPKLGACIGSRIHPGSEKDQKKNG